MKISENLELQGTMNDVYAISSNVTLGEEASIRDFKVISENTIIDGVVNRNAYVLGENVNIGESYSAKVDGTLYTSAEILGSTANINSIEKIEKLRHFSYCSSAFTWAILCPAFSQYLGFISIPTYCLPKRFDTAPVVPLPKNGSNTIPPFGQPANIHGSINFSGYIAKCSSIL